MELTLVEILVSLFHDLRRQLLLLPDLPLLVSGLVFVMVARSKECTTILGDRLLSSRMNRPELPVMFDPRGTAKIESGIGMNGVNPKEDNRLKKPIGFGFRLGALEQSLRQHFQELEAQRALLADFKPKVEGIMTHKIDLQNRLDKTFSDVNSKVDGLDKSYSMAKEALRAKFGSILQSMSSKLDNIEHEMKSLLERAETLLLQLPLLDLVPRVNPGRRLEQRPLCPNHGVHSADPTMHGQTTAHLHRLRRVLRLGRERLLLKRLQDMHRHRLRHMRLRQVDGRLPLETTMAHGPRKIGLPIIESLQILSRLMARSITTMTGVIACVSTLL